MLALCACRTSGLRTPAEVSAPRPIQTAPSALMPTEQTAAERQFAAWLTAFNSGNRESLLVYYQQVVALAAKDQGFTIDMATGLSELTGGFDVMKSETATQTTMSAIVKAKHARQFVQLSMEVDTTPAHRVVHFEIQPIPTPDEFLSDEERRSGAGPVDSERRRAIIDGIAREITAHYVYPEAGQRTIEALQAHAERGDYDVITRGDAFALALTKDLVAVSHDQHLIVNYGPLPPQPPSPQGPCRSPSGRASPEQQAEFRAMNFGFGAIERLHDNIARVVINEFLPVDDVREVIADFMTQVADADALIVDLRDNRGGFPETVALLLSYLFDSKPVHLNDQFCRDDGSTQQFWTMKDLKGKRFGGKKPIYVLTSHQTASGGEEFAYDLQSLHRATLIGETTTGAANPNSPRSIDGWYTMLVPNARSINPVTKTDWEGVGVKPDVPVAADAALDEALRRASRELATRKPRGANR